MKPIRSLYRHVAAVLMVSLLPALSAGAARAGCADVPAPGVEWRRCFLDGLDLAGVDLSGAVIRDSSFKRTDLEGAVLTGVDGRRAKFVSARLVGADLSGANLVQADFTNADLTGARLVDADLRYARLFRAVLRDADLTGARLDRADFLYADLAGATWVDGRTVCGEGSVGRCHPARGDRATAGPARAGDLPAVVPR